MTATEFTFLAVGLVLGVAAGAALLLVLRARSPVPREVRVTVAQDAIPHRRSATLSADAFMLADPAPAWGGPADPRLEGQPMPGVAADRRTIVLSEPEPRAMVGISVDGGDDPILEALQASTRILVPTTAHP